MIERKEKQPRKEKQWKGLRGIGDGVAADNTKATFKADKAPLGLTAPSVASGRHQRPLGKNVLSEVKPFRISASASTGVMSFSAATARLMT